MDLAQLASAPFDHPLPFDSPSPLTELEDSDVEMNDASDPLVIPPAPSPSFVSLSTTFDPSHIRNRKANFRSKDSNGRLEDTDRERQYAINAEYATSLDDLSSKVCLFFFWNIVPQLTIDSFQATSNLE